MLSFLGSLALIVLFVVVALAVALCANGNDTATASLTSYYFRATIEAEGDDDVLGSVQGWYQAPDRWRWDFGDEEDPDAGSFQVSDGDTVVYYDRATNVFTRQTLAAYREGVPVELTEGPPVLPASLALGWLPQGDREAYFQRWQDGTVTEATGGTVAGRPTDAVTISIQGGTVKLWIDRSLPFVLKYEARATGGPLSLIRAEVMEFLPNAELAQGAFAFEAPPGAQEVSTPERGPTGGSGAITIGPDDSTVTAPRGFLAPGYVPPGYSVQGSGETHLGIGVQARFTVRWEGPGGYLDMVQQFRAGGLSEAQRQGEPVNIGDVQGYDQSDGDITRLVFARDDIVVALESDALGLEELVRVGEGLR